MIEHLIHETAYHRQQELLAAAERYRAVQIAEGRNPHRGTAWRWLKSRLGPAFGIFRLRRSAPTALPRTGRIDARN